jgi:hypothetical protein
LSVTALLASSTVGNLDVPALTLLLGLELLALRRGQRRLFWATVDTSRSRMLAYLLALPGTVLHEGAHYLACVLLGVPVGRELAAHGGAPARVRLFWPQRTPEGDVVLGGVPHARTDPLRQALIATAPLILIPSLLAGATALLLGPHALAQLPDALGRVPLWQAVAWAYLSLSCGQAAFPSPGDHVGVLGTLFLVGLAAASVWLLVAVGIAASATAVLSAAVWLLALPAGAASLLLVAFGLTRRASRPG